jgi:hypothetical protein
MVRRQSVRLSFHSNKRILFTSLILGSIALCIHSQDCEVILFSSHYILSREKLLEKETIVLQVNNRMGENYTEFLLPYSNKNKLNSLEAQIEDLQGQVIRKLKKSEILNVNAVSDANLYSDDFLSVFQLKHNIYPYRIRVVYENVYSQYMQIAKWVPVQDYRIPTRKAELIVEVPADYNLLYEQEYIDLPEIIETENSRQYIWHTAYDKPRKFEESSPPMHLLLPTVTVLPEKFFYTIEGAYTDWCSIGSWFCRLNADLDVLTPMEQYNISLVTNKLKSDLEKTRAIYHYLQDNTRYINVSIDIGGLKTYPASYVCENKYGDCKALTNYMKALLKESGIQSYFALINSNEKAISPSFDFPELNFNHVILYVPLDEDTLWLECTSNLNPFGYVHSSIQNRYALIIDEDNSRLVKVPPMSDAISERMINCTIQENGTAIFVSKIKARGTSFESLRFFNTNLSEHEKRQEIDNLFNFQRYNLESWNIVQPERDTAFIFLSSQLSVLEMAKTYGNEMVLKLISLNIPDFEPPVKRLNSVQIDYPKGTIDSITIDIPEGFSFVTVPPEFSIKNEFGEYSLHCTVVKNNRIFVFRRFILFPKDYSLTEYPGLFAFIKLVEKKENENVILFNNSLK